MPHTIFDRVNKWSMSTTASADFISLFSQIEYLAEKQFSEYHPTSGPPHKEFTVRLRDWLDSAADEEDQQTLLRLVPHLFFIGSREFRSLYRAAFNGPITRWLIDELALDFSSPDFHDDLWNAIKHTWFCGITDSMQIAEFHHVNNIEGADLRPDWRTLARFAEPQRVKAYMDTNRLQRVVLLEDFVGTGTQMTTSVNFASTIPGAPSVLVLPLITAPGGIEVGSALSSSFSNISFATTLELLQAAFVCDVSNPNESNLFQIVRELIVRLYPILTGGRLGNEDKKPYGPFGYNRGTPRRGALVVMYTNCPDNTLPIIHYSSQNWSPLFPRSSRV